MALASTKCPDHSAAAVERGNAPKGARQKSTEHAG